MTGDGLIRPPGLRVSRRKLLLGLGAGALAAPLSGCDAGSPAALSILEKAERLDHSRPARPARAAHRAGAGILAIRDHLHFQAERFD